MASDLKLAKAMTYCYIKCNDELDLETEERQPLREIKLGDPDKYDGFLGQALCNQQYNTDTCFIVTGHIEKCDGSYFNEFELTNVQGTSIYLSAYPEDI